MENVRGLIKKDLPCFEPVTASTLVLHTTTIYHQLDSVPLIIFLIFIYYKWHRLSSAVVLNFREKTYINGEDGEQPASWKDSGKKRKSIRNQFSNINTEIRCRDFSCHVN